MPSAQSNSLDFLWLHNARPAGPVIGKIGDDEIPESVIDEFGRAYNYVGLAPRTWNGILDADGLKTGEFLFRSGLVYRLITCPTTWVDRLLSKIGVRRE